MHSVMPSQGARLTNRIILRHTPAHWLAEFVGPLAAQVRSLYGSSEIPTAFDGSVPAKVVHRAMATLNPNAELLVEGQPHGDQGATQAAKGDDLSLDFTKPDAIPQKPLAARQPSLSSSLAKADQSLDFTGSAAIAPPTKGAPANRSVDAIPAANVSALDAFAAEVVGMHAPRAATNAPATGAGGTRQPVASPPAPSLPAAVAETTDGKQRLTLLKRAASLRKELGTLVACSYLKEKGWTFEDAHKALKEFSPHRSEPARVLIVDDNLDTVHTTTLLLRSSGHKVEFAINGIAALFIAQRFRPDFILLELALPDSDGIDLARQLKHHPDLKDTCIVAMTGHGEENRGRAISAGCDQYLVKPVAPALLEAMIDGPRTGRL